MLPSTIPLNPEEQVIRTVRRHWFRVVVEAVSLGAVFFVVTMVVLVGDVVLLELPGSTLSTGKAAAVSVFFVAFVGLILWMRFFATWSDHWLDVWIITNKRIIDVEQKGFFTREVSSFPLERIQDVTYDISGIIATWLHFGNVRIQTASVSTDFIMKEVPHPDTVKDMLVHFIDQTNDQNVTHDEKDRLVPDRFLETVR